MPKITLPDGTQINISEATLQEVIAKQVKSEPEHSLGWTPKIREGYYYLDEDYEIFNNVFLGDEGDKVLGKIGNAYKTRPEAERVVEKAKALRRIHEYMRKNDLFFTPDWSDDKYKYAIAGWDYVGNEPLTSTWFAVDASKGNLIFKSNNDRQMVLDNCAKDLEIYLKDY